MILKILKLSNSQVKEWNNFNEYKDVASVSNVLCNIHQECLTVRNGCCYTNLWSVCNFDIKNNEIPKFSIANSHDYGEISRLKDFLPQSVVEMHLISRNRMYASIMKLKEGSNNRQLLGNVIIFEHDGPEKCSKILTSRIIWMLKILKSCFCWIKTSIWIKSERYYYIMWWTKC